MGFVLMLVALAACGGKSTPAQTLPTEMAKATLPDVPFAQLDPEQRKQFMEQKVLPALKPIFQNHDAQKFAKFQCETCHGTGAAQGRFDMPNAELPKLTNDMSKFEKRDIEWMEREVSPTVAKLLQMPEYSKENPKGFSCLACHTMAGT